MTFVQILNNIELFESHFLKKAITGYRREDYVTILKSALRQNYFQAVETVFELIFALYDLKEGTFHDNDIHVRLANSPGKKNYNQIEKIAGDKNLLDYLDKEVDHFGITMTVGRHLFYFRISPDSNRVPVQFRDSIPESLLEIKKGLHLLAQDFIDRTEYNSYKHALRVFPFLTNFSFQSTENREVGPSFDLSNSLTFLSRRIGNEGEGRVITKTFDTRRDINMTLFCSNLISNMILIRKADLDLLDGEEKPQVHFFNEGYIKVSSKLASNHSKLIWEQKDK